MIVDLINYTRRVTIHPQDRTQLNNSAKNGGGITLMPGAGENDGWMVKYVVFHYPGGGKAWNVKQVYTNYNGSTAASGGNLRIRPNGSTDDVITPISAATIMPSSDAAYALQSSTHELEEDAAIEVGASAAITAGNDVLEIVVVADKIDL